WFAAVTGWRNRRSTRHCASGAGRKRPRCGATLPRCRPTRRSNTPPTMTLRLPLLPTDPRAPFPDPRAALRVPDGLLAMGGDLSPPRLLNAYRHGIFPWYSEGEPLLWWCPDPRTVFRTDAVRLSSRFRRSLRASDWIVR